MSDAPEESVDAVPYWPAFGDLMACVFGLFVMFFVWSIAFQVDLTKDLHEERQKREEESSRLAALERVMAGPLAEGRVTLVDGKIGIRGSVLFDLNSAELRPEGIELIKSLAEPLRLYLKDHDELIMVSGFTDSSPIIPTPNGSKDNWELSSQRALTVTRELTLAGIPPEAIFAAGFGDTHPVAPNDTPENRAKNRRVEISPIPKEPAKAEAKKPASSTASTESVEPTSVPTEAAPSASPPGEAP